MQEFDEQLADIVTALEDYMNWEIKERKYFDIDDCTSSELEEHNQEMRHYVNKGVWL